MGTIKQYIAQKRAYNSTKSNYKPLKMNVLICDPHGTKLEPSSGRFEAVE